MRESELWPTYPGKAPCCSFCGWQVQSAAASAPPPVGLCFVRTGGTRHGELAAEVEPSASAGPTSFDELLSLFQQDAPAPAVSDGSGPTVSPVEVSAAGLAPSPLPLAMAAQALGSPTSGSLMPAQAGPASGFPTVGHMAMFHDMLGAAAAGGSRLSFSKLSRRRSTAVVNKAC